MRKLNESFDDLLLPKFLQYEPNSIEYTDLGVNVDDEWCRDYWDHANSRPDQECGTTSGVINNWSYIPTSDDMYNTLETIFNKPLDKITQEEIDMLDEDLFMDALQEYCRPMAIEDAFDNHDTDDIEVYEPDWDSMPGGHDDYDFDECLLQEKKKKKPYSSITYTTGDVQKNVDHFNKVLSGKAPNTHLDGLPRVGLSPDGASSLPTGGESSSGGGEGGGDAGGCCESIKNKHFDLQLDESIGWYIKNWD